MNCCGRTTRSITACLCLLAAVAPAIAASEMRCLDGSPCPVPVIDADGHACCAPQPRHCDPPPVTTRCIEVRLSPAPIAAERTDTKIPASDFATPALPPRSAASIPTLAHVAPTSDDLPPPMHPGRPESSPRAPPDAR